MVIFEGGLSLIPAKIGEGKLEDSDLGYRRG